MGMKVEKASRAISESNTPSARVFPRIPFSHPRTVFAHLEGLICFPSDDTTGKSTPAPLHHPAEDLIPHNAISA